MFPCWHLGPLSTHLPLSIQIQYNKTKCGLDLSINPAQMILASPTTSSPPAIYLLIGCHPTTLQLLLQSLIICLGSPIVPPSILNFHGVWDHHSLPLTLLWLPSPNWDKRCHSFFLIIRLSNQNLGNTLSPLWFPIWLRSSVGSLWDLLCNHRHAHHTESSSSWDFPNPPAPS